jgi:formate-dependent nitrite reductase membrane component NrfD
MELEIIEHMSYDWRIALYIFLGGLSGGSYLLSIAAKYWIKEFKPFAKTAALIAPVALAAGLLVLVLDLGRPFRFWRLFLSFNATSALSWGVWFLSIFFAISVIYGYFFFRGKESLLEKRKVKVLAYIGVPFAVLAASYTAVLLIQAPGRALWHSALLPVLFFNGGLISGIAATLLIQSLGKQTTNPSRLGKVLSWLIIAELCFLFVEFLVLMNGGGEYVRIAKHITSGDYRLLFWFVEILVGSVVPVVVLLFFKKHPSYSVGIASAAALLGIFTMRFIVVVGGQVPTNLF